MNYKCLQMKFDATWFIQADGCDVSTNEQPSEGEQILFHGLDLYHKSPDSGELQYKSTNYKRRFDPVLGAGQSHMETLVIDKLGFN